MKAVGLSKKETDLVHLENRKLTVLDQLKEKGGPFMPAKPIDTYFLTAIEDVKGKDKTNDLCMRYICISS